MRFLHFLCLSSKILKECGCNFTWCFGKIMWIKSLKMVFVAKIIRHKLCMIYALFVPLLKKSFKGWGCILTWSFCKVIRIKSQKMVFVERIIRHKLCMIYAFFDFFVQKSFLYTCLVWILQLGQNWVSVVEYWSLY